MQRAGWGCLALVAAAACGDPGLLSSPNGARALSIMSYNLANLSGVDRQAIAGQLAAAAPDFAGLQECAECDELADSISARYALAAQPRAGVAILYDASRWRVDAEGSIELGQNDDGWGQRVAVWARMEHLDGPDRVTVYSTHFCVTLRADDDACDEQRQLAYADSLRRLVDDRATTGAVVAGDFNVFDGFEDGAVIERLLEAGWIDVFRSHAPDADGTTFLGNSWAPAGRLDYIFATQPVVVLDSFIDRASLADSAGSDHYPVAATVEFGDVE